tara:strand:+ start:156 stop:404 length:249 start_codon:yes stop_codon:yes gene_type:complete
MADETRTADELAQDYTAMGHSVDLINGVIDGSKMADENQEEKNDCVDRNVRHLEIMVAKEDWGSEDMTPSNDAITAGKAYIA